MLRETHDYLLAKALHVTAAPPVEAPEAMGVSTRCVRWAVMLSGVVWAGIAAGVWAAL